MGDLYVLSESRACAGDHVAIIDGFFEQRPAVWHKEILYALSRGIHVYGASSMGALRAAELETFGMRGVGRIFEAYRDGLIEDDDEVAVAHAPKELGFRVISTPLVSIRFELDRLVREGALAPSLARHLLEKMKATPYGDRLWSAVIDEATLQRADPATIDLLEHASRAPDAKGEDARALLRLLAAKVEGETRPHQAQFTFACTSYWASLTQSLSMRVRAATNGRDGDDERGEEIVAHFRASDGERERVLDEALFDRLALDVARGLIVKNGDLKEAALRIARRNRIESPQELEAWRFERDLGDAEWRSLLEADARRHWLRGRLVHELDPFVAVRLKSEGKLAAIRERLDRARERIASVGSDKPSVADFGITYDELQRWYEARLGPMDPEPAVHVRQLGFADLRSFLTALFMAYLAEESDESEVAGSC